jgi:hypothetical protein
MDDQRLSFELPRIAGRDWLKAIDTSLDSPDDAVGQRSEPMVTPARLDVPDRTAVVLISR